MSLEDYITKGLSHIQDLRIGLNAVGVATRDFVDSWVQDAWGATNARGLLYITKEPVAKYPLMRRMFYDSLDPLAELVMWFDDDTFFIDHCSDSWWSSMLSSMENYHMIGQCHWYMPVQGKQWDWVKTQPWYNPKVGMPRRFKGKHAFQFCQGSWWVIRRDVLHELDWPIKELHHNGGDSMLGEALRHKDYRMGFFDEHLRLNADDRGRNSKARRRGISENRIGYNFNGSPLPVDHHEFHVQKIVLGESKLISLGRLKVIDLFPNRHKVVKERR